MTTSKAAAWTGRLIAGRIRCPCIEACLLLSFIIDYAISLRRAEWQLKRSLAIHLTAIATTLMARPAVADQSDKLIGLSEEQLISCAGIPAGQMVSGNSTFFQYGEFNERGAFVPLGNTLFITKRQKGCQAVITLRNGVVTKVMLKTKGLISGPMACQRIFPNVEIIFSCSSIHKKCSDVYEQSRSIERWRETRFHSVLEYEVVRAI